MRNRLTRATRNTWRHSLIAVSWLLLCVLVLPLPILVSAQSAPAPIEVYRSPEFGYVLWWNADDWAVQEQGAEPGYDWIELASEDVNIVVLGYAEPGVTAESCLATRLDELESDPGFVHAEELDPTAGVPPVIVSNEGRNASTSLSIEFDDPSGPEKIAALEQCITFIPGESMLALSTWRPMAAYEADGSMYAEPLQTLTSPRAAWIPLPDGSGSIGPRLPSYGVTPHLVRDAAGEELGVLSVHSRVTSCTSGGSVLDEVTQVVVAEGTGAQDWTIAPNAFVLNANGTDVAPTRQRWLEPRLEPAQEATVHEGQVALLELTFTGIGAGSAALDYLDPSGSRRELAPIGCGGAGSSAPIVIDME
jgi:hypothetical protein